ncbi:FAD-dependent oxidoreductase [Myxococcaceae bacterium GXIMD 01537]
MATYASAMAATSSPRFCIIGAGAAGISAALKLKELGYRDITVLETASQVGGKCRTVEFEGQAIDTGAIYVLPNYPVISSYIQQAGLTQRPASPFIHFGDDGSTRPFGTPPKPLSLGAKVAEYGRLGLEILKYRQLFDRPLGKVDPEVVRAMSVPFGQWAREHRLDYFLDAAFPLLRGFGFGYEEQEVPALYVFKIFPQLAAGGNLLRLWDVGGVELTHLNEGYGELWRRLAAGFDVRLNVNVQRVERTDAGVRVHTGEETLAFDHLILACPLDAALGFLDASDEERDIFSRIRWLDVWQAHGRIDGVPDAFLIDSNHRYDRLGHSLIVFRYRTDSNLYYCFGYAQPSMDEAQLLARLQEDIARVKGRALGDFELKRWKYFPHFSSADVAAGCHARIEALQGRRSTWYAGEVVSLIGVESSASYSRSLVERQWGRAARSAA